MVLLRVLDIETTGLAPPAEIIEIGRVDVFEAGGAWLIKQPLSRLYRPLQGIPPETKAIHHITEADFAPNSEPSTSGNLRSAVMNPDKPDALVAHNCAFERTFIPERATDGLPWICTYKCALRIWPDAPGHSNQVLRYWRQLVLDPKLSMPPHRAGPDAWVTAHLLVEMLAMTSVEQLIEWTSLPKALAAMPFGKYRNQKWEDLPLDYLSWLVRQADIDDDVAWNVKQEIAKRENR